MKYKIFYRIIYLLLILLLLCNCSKTRPKPKGHIIAQVKDSYLTYEELQKLIPKEYLNYMSPEEKMRYVDNWIETEILYREALKENLIADSSVAHRLYEIERQFLADEFRLRYIEENLIFSETELQDYYKKHPSEFTYPETVIKIPHILFHNRQEAVSRLWEVKRNKKAFPEMVKKYSEDHLSIENEGDLGYFTYSEMILEIPEIWSEIENASISDITNVIQTRYGYHIIQVTDRYDKGSLKPFERCKDEVMSKLHFIFQEIKYKKWIAELKVNTKINTDYTLLRQPFAIESPIDTTISDIVADSTIVDTTN